MTNTRQSRPSPTDMCPLPGQASGAADREELPDQLRGLALLGIVLVNMPFLAISNAGFTEASLAGTADRATAFLITAFAQGKFYLLFSFLFGYSLTLMLRRRTSDGLRRFRRRLVGLAVLGLAHALLFFVGDILLSYALLGVMLLWFVERSDRAAWRGVVLSMSVAVLILGLVVLASIGQPEAGIVEDPSSVDAAFVGSFADAVVARAGSLPGVLVFLAVINWGLIIAMFLLGLLAGRHRVLAAPRDHPLLWRRLLVLGIVVGLPGGLLSGWLSFGSGSGGDLRDIVGLAIGFATAPALTGGYLALAVRARPSRAMAFFAPAGRMSLTGYLGESILLSAIFCGWGLGWFGQLGAFEAALVAIAVWFVLELFARWWLRRFANGPFEWLLRSWSYGGWAPLLARSSDMRGPTRSERPV